MIDVHVHLRDWNQAYKETIEHGLKVASGLGFKAICDMPNTDPPLTSLKTIQKRITDAQIFQKKYGIQYYCYAGLTDNPVQIQEVVHAVTSINSVIGLKYFASHSTGNMGIIAEQNQKNLFETLVELNYTGFLAIHAEDTRFFGHKDPQSQLQNYNNLEKHNANRPLKAETSAVKKQIQFAKTAGFRGHMHICHITSTETLDIIEQVRPTVPFIITTGVTPSHLLLNTQTATNLCQINPPIRTEVDRQKLYKALIKHRIDWVESDHAPHSLEDKKNGISGVPALIGNLYLLHKLQTDGIDPTLVVALFGNTVKKLLKINVPIIIPTIAECTTRIKQYINEYPFNPYEYYFAHWH